MDQGQCVVRNCGASADGDGERCQRHEARRRSSALRRSRLRAAGGSERIDRLWLLGRDGGVCHLCGQRVDPGLRWPDQGSASVDHLVPISRGGATTWLNVGLSHLRCNLSKGARPLRSLEFLLDDPPTAQDWRIVRKYGGFGQFEDDPKWEPLVLIEVVSARIREPLTQAVRSN